MANNPIQWTTQATWTTPLQDELQNLTTGTYALTASPIDNRGGDQFADFVFYANGSAAFAAGAYCSLWMIQSIDGTTANYERGGTTATAPARPADVIFPLAATSDQQSVVIRSVAFPNSLFKLLFYNASGTGLENTSSVNKIIYVSYNSKLVTA